jgi:TIR domain-containing protein
LQIRKETAVANVFISHRGADVLQAERLASELRAAGHQVWFDEWNIGLGDSIVERMNEGLEGAAYVVVCYSAAGVTSPWMGREWMAALARQLDGCGVKILPVRLTGGDPPAILADLKYADLVKDWDKGVSELLKAIR